MLTPTFIVIAPLVPVAALHLEFISQFISVISATNDKDDTPTCEISVSCNPRGGDQHMSLSQVGEGPD